MRIAIFENLPPGGALRACFEIGRELAARGHEIHLFRLDMYRNKGDFDLAPYAKSVDATPFRPLAGVLDARIQRISLAPRAYTLFGPLRRAHEKVASKIRAGGYDVVLLHHDALSQTPYALRWLDGVPTVYYCQEPLRVAMERAILNAHRRHLARPPRPVGWMRLLEDRLAIGRLARAECESAQHARVIVVNSVYSRERAWAAYARNAVVCYLGIDPLRFSPPASPQPRRNEVLSIGLPVAAKGHELVVDALALLPAASRPALHVVLPRRDGTERLEQRAREKDVRLTIDVGVDDQSFVERYRQAMATVCAARLEPFGLTSIESMACGTPVVAIREAGFRETVIDSETGFLVEPEPHDLAAGIARLAGDTDLVEKMGARGRRQVEERWTWRRTGDQMEQILMAAKG